MGHHQRVQSLGEQAPVTQSARGQDQGKHLVASPATEQVKPIALPSGSDIHGTPAVPVNHAHPSESEVANSTLPRPLICWFSGIKFFFIARAPCKPRINLFSYYCAPHFISKVPMMTCFQLPTAAS